VFVVVLTEHQQTFPDPAAPEYSIAPVTSQFPAVKEMLVIFFGVALDKLTDPDEAVDWIISPIPPAPGAVVVEPKVVTAIFCVVALFVLLTPGKDISLQEASPSPVIAFVFEELTLH
jgi:hypothetical protein